MSVHLTPDSGGADNLPPEIKSGTDFADKVTNLAASKLHKNWQTGFFGDGGKERWKAVKTENWTKDLGSFGRFNEGRFEIDIAHLDYENLSPDWQKENLESAKVGTEALANLLENHDFEDVKNAIEAAKNKKDTISKKDLLGNELIEAGREIHNKWLERNNWVGPDDPMSKPFEELDVSNQRKDIEVLEAALDAFIEEGRKVSEQL